MRVKYLPGICRTRRLISSFRRVADTTGDGNPHFRVKTSRCISSLPNPSKIFFSYGPRSPEGGVGAGISDFGIKNSNSAKTSSTDSTNRAPSFNNW